MANRGGARKGLIAVVVAAAALSAAQPAAALGARIDDNGLFSWIAAFFGGETGARETGADTDR